MTGLIYVAILALWAAVLIPMWLRRHDDDQARRIERHRLAMGTLARISDDPESAQGTAARRRRFIMAGAATVGALATVAWIAGLLPGVVAGALWLPLLCFLPLAVVSERRSTRASAERALEERRERRMARTTGTDVRAEHLDDHAERESSDRRVDVPPVSTVLPPTRPLAWDEIFDQTA